jgi:rhodanese-related sulfurtransferase
MTRAIGEMIILISVSIVIGLVVNTFSPIGIPLFGNWDSSTGVVNAGGICKPTTKEVPEDEINDVYLQQNIVFVDARSTDDYQAGHIPRAVSLPVREFFELKNKFLAKYSFPTPIVVYCTGVECNDSHELAKLLEDSGYSNIRVYSRGFEGWTEKDRPKEMGSNDES